MKPLEQALARDGFAVLRGVAGPGAFERELVELGRVVLRSTVELRPEVPTYLCRTDAVPFHTDHPDVNVVAWWCQEQDEHDGASLLVDMHAVLATLDAASRRALSDVYLPCPEIHRTTDAACARKRAVASPSRSVYFASWLRPDTAAAGMIWTELVERVVKTRPHEIRLTSGEALLIDNRRMVHGRRALGACSKRRLLRAWVLRGDVDERG